MMRDILPNFSSSSSSSSTTQPTFSFTSSAKAGRSQPSHEPAICYRVMFVDTQVNLLCPNASGSIYRVAEGSLVGRDLNGFILASLRGNPVVHSRSTILLDISRCSGAAIP